MTTREFREFAPILLDAAERARYRVVEISRFRVLTTTPVFNVPQGTISSWATTAPIPQTAATRITVGWSAQDRFSHRMPSSLGQGTCTVIGAAMRIVIRRRRRRKLPRVSMRTKSVAMKIRGGCG